MKNAPLSVLIVDDSLLFREGLVNMFASQPDFIVVGEAGSVQEAIARARQFRPDIILMDFGLPDGNGADATHAIMSDLPDARIVILTIDDADERLMAAIRSGAKGYLLKEMPFSKLLAALRALMKDEAAISRKLTMKLLEEISRTHLHPKPGESELVDLTRREVEILRELASEASNQEIADRLSLSVPTVKHYVHKVLIRLNLRNRKEAARYARHEGLGTYAGLQSARTKV